MILGLKKFLFIVILFLVFQSLFGQSKSNMITKGYKFEDGVYYNLEALLSKKPTYNWNQVKASLITNPQTNVTKVEFIYRGNKDIATDSVLYLVTDGMPYYKINSDTISKLINFAGIVVRGKLSYLQFPISFDKDVKITAYNPYNGLPFVTGSVKRTKNSMIKKILALDTGNIYDFSLDQLKYLIKEDKKLLVTMDDEKDWNDDKILKCLLIYNDRNPFFIKNNK